MTAVEWRQPFLWFLQQTVDWMIISIASWVQIWLFKNRSNSSSFEWNWNSGRDKRQWFTRCETEAEMYGSPFLPLNKNKKSYCDFLSHNSDFFSIIAWYKLAILRTVFFPPSKLDFNSQFRLYSSPFIARNSDFIARNCEFISQWYKTQSSTSHQILVDRWRTCRRSTASWCRSAPAWRARMSAGVSGDGASAEGACERSDPDAAARGPQPSRGSASRALLPGALVWRDHQRSERRSCSSNLMSYAQLLDGRRSGRWWSSAPASSFTSSSRDDNTPHAGPHSTVFTFSVWKRCSLSCSGKHFKWTHPAAPWDGDVPLLSATEHQHQIKRVYF